MAFFIIFCAQCVETFGKSLNAGEDLQLEVSPLGNLETCGPWMPSTQIRSSGESTRINSCRCPKTRLQPTLLHLRKKNIHIRSGNRAEKLIENTVRFPAPCRHFRKILTADSRPNDARIWINLNTTESPPPNLERT